MNPLPRVLFLTSESPHTGAAGAIVFHRLFGDYPPERLLVVTSNLPPKDAGRLACRYVHLPLKVDRLNRTRFWTWRTALRALGGSALLSLRRIDRALGDFKPDVVVTLMQDSWYYDYAARYARRRGWPLVLLVHDLPDGFEPVPGWLRPRQEQRDASVYRGAARRICISEPMQAHFAARFGVSGDVLAPPRAETLPHQDPGECRQLKQPGRLTLGYAGGLHYGYGEQLLRLLPVLRATGTRLELFSPTPGGKLAGLNEASDVLCFHGRAPTPEEAWRRLLVRCDAVLQPYLNPPGEHAGQYRTHFPSKLGDALSLGLPLLITGPADASGVAWCLTRPGCALVTVEPEPLELTAALGLLRDDAALRVALATAGRQAAAFFDPAPARSRFATLLADAAATH